jgi:hypothetical protein
MINTPIVVASVWGEDLIIPDIWLEGVGGPTPDDVSGRMANYYLKQMNFLGNNFEV